ncbi:hypothetical protein ACFL6H_00675 [Candidatus Latescibacterota bacterium]
MILPKTSSLSSVPPFERMNIFTGSNIIKRKIPARTAKKYNKKTDMGTYTPV